jgi:hypothetical protein
MARRSRPTRGSTRRVRPGLLVVCALALVATAGVRVAGGDDGAPAGDGADLAPATVETTTTRPAGAPPEAPDRNPFGTPGGPATSPDPDGELGTEDPAVDGATDDAGGTEDTAVDGGDVASRIAPGG